MQSLFSTAQSPGLGTVTSHQAEYVWMEEWWEEASCPQVLTAASLEQSLNSSSHPTRPGRKHHFRLEAQKPAEVLRAWQNPN